MYNTDFKSLMDTLMKVLQAQSKRADNVDQRLDDIDRRLSILTAALMVGAETMISGDRDASND